MYLIAGLSDYYFLVIMGFMGAGIFTAFMWGYVLGLSQVEIEEEQAHQ